MLLPMVDPLRALVHLDHRRCARERDIIALRTPTIASAIMIGLALFRNWLLHQLANSHT